MGLDQDKVWSNLGLTQDQTRTKLGQNYGQSRTNQSPNYFTSPQHTFFFLLDLTIAFYITLGHC